jgi:hypothetical protein
MACHPHREPTGGVALPQSVGRGAEFPRSKNLACHPPDLSSHRRRDPQPHLLHFLALVLRTELLERLVASGGAVPEWRYIIDDLLDLSAVEVDQDGRRALLRTATRPSINPICRALGLTLPPIFQEVPTETASNSAD